MMESGLLGQSYTLELQLLFFMTSVEVTMHLERMDKQKLKRIVGLALMKIRTV